MNSAVQPSTDDESEIVVSVDCTDASSPRPPTPAPDATRKVYCQGDDCRAKLHQDALDPTSAMHVEGSVDIYCPSCFSKLPGKPEPSPVRQLPVVSSFKNPKCDGKLDKYKAIMEDSHVHLVYLAIVVIFWPLAWGYFCTKLQHYPLPEPSYTATWRDRLHWIMAAVSHLQCFCCCAYIWFIFVVIYQSCEYAAQAWFWVLLEFYTLYFLLLNVIYVATPIVPAKPLRDAKQIVRAMWATHRTRQINNRWHLMLRRRTTKTPLLSSQKYHPLVVAVNIWLMLSWVTHAWPSRNFGIPIETLIQLPANVRYNVVGTMTDICQPNDDGTFRAVWNLALTPTPSVMNGLPTIELSFATRLLDPVYFTDLAVGTLWLVAQDTYSMAVRPAVNQHIMTIQASFGNVSSCDDVANLLVLHSTTYSQKSLQDRLEAAPRGLALLPTFLLAKYCFQMLVVAGIVGYSSLQILSLWLQFDALTKKVDLTLHQNLDVWYRLRNRVFKVVTFYTQFVTSLMSIALVQLTVAISGLVIYCLSGVAPLPGYYLLILTMVGSLSTLVFLLPLANALDIQASHEAMLHALTD
ncbi:hypothetical protein SPRG_12026 [Saprolegnia parasitica CBS 223.65]|uniref:Transmembrane protein n=1 Tax=Saprolegnia parasitica (strain CBS 223.65) TaxID=695850 RepID=A0A067BWH8_SAPPC|nr:hypothetical protein SPRG_12026 [Saprolegnia parasitica CBS 223.65]KDO22889.1 hypothetical protein SPRG_12026 [Saprolegnia parasitica CBS 223.65]|eukprot:XP_012206444.1 hypothetical protein SPRG_12026 [Saprolegnia parasitica CBS 223.65]